MMLLLAATVRTAQAGQVIENLTRDTYQPDAVTWCCSLGGTVPPKGRGLVAAESAS
jgi:hypothetical protein